MRCVFAPSRGGGISGLLFEGTPANTMKSFYFGYFCLGNP